MVIWLEHLFLMDRYHYNWYTFCDLLTALSYFSHIFLEWKKEWTLNLLFPPATVDISDNCRLHLRRLMWTERHFSYILHLFSCSHHTQLIHTSQALPSENFFSFYFSVHLQSYHAIVLVVLLCFSFGRTNYYWLAQYFRFMRCFNLIHLDV